MDTDLTTVLDLVPHPDAIRVDHKLVHQSGVWFGLDEDEYHAALALSASGIKHLRISTLDWWVRSPLNPERTDEEESFAKTLGRAYHRRILEGKAAFDRDYAPSLTPDDHPGALRTAEELKQRCVDLGLKVGGSKAELIERILAKDPEHIDVIWDRIHADYVRRNEGKTLLAADLIGKIEIAAKMIEAHPELKKCISGGMPEVSVFFADRESGVPVKCRFDYLKPRMICDLKTAENTIGLPIDKAVAKAIASYRLHIQAALYLEAVHEAKRLIAAGKVYGTVDKAFLNALVAAPEHTFLFLFQMKGPAPVARGYVLPHGMTLDIGRQEVDLAKAAFARAWKTYGTDPWVDIAEITTLDPTCFPSWIAD